MPRTTDLLLSTLFATTALAPLAAQAPRGADARADAKAEARADGADRSHQSRSSSHRVVVRNGRTIVDERTENGRPVPSGKAGPSPKAGGAPAPAMPDPEELLRQMRERMRRQLEGALPDRPGPEGDMVRDLRERLQRDMERQIDEDIDRARSGERSSERSGERSSKRSGGRSDERGSSRATERDRKRGGARGGARPSVDDWKTPVKKQPKRPEAPKRGTGTGGLRPRRG